MPEDLHQVAPLATEHIQVPGMRIALQRLLNLQRQAVHATPHVRGTCRQPDPNAGRREHQPRNTVITRRNAGRLTSGPILIVVPSGSRISISSAPLQAATGDGAISSERGTSLRRTGTKPGASTARSRPSRT